MNKHDLVFLKHFAQVIAVLFGIMVLLILGATYIYAGHAPPPSAKAVAADNARIAPLSGVYAGETGRQAMVEAQKAAEAALKANVPFGGSTDGGTIFAGLCTACHTAGVGGAPKLVKAEWTDRIAQGEELLIKHATEGYDGAAPTPMPARGGNPALTDEQVKATVEWMLANIK